VSGIGEVVVDLPFEHRSYLLVLPPFGVDTASVYRAWDDRARAERSTVRDGGSNDLEAAALEVEPRLAGWKRALEEATGRRAHLAGSGSTWFVEGTAADLGVDVGAGLTSEGQRAPLVATSTTPRMG
jgi:4-diphosphocytidyl-2C-methyl-D-erythritol kinase